jgi:hypothetical protein
LIGEDLLYNAAIHACQQLKTLLLTAVMKAIQPDFDGPEVEMKKLLMFGLLITAVLAGCTPEVSVQGAATDTRMQLTAPGPNPLINQPDGLGRVARAGAGLWHGLIAPVTLVFSFFDSGIHMYEVHNAGSEYDLGFLLGVTIMISLLGLFIRLRR